jgi:hypothetical protein
MRGRWAVFFALFSVVSLYAAEGVRIVPLVRDDAVLVSFELTDGYTPAVKDAVHSGLKTTFTYEIELRQDVPAWVDRTIATSVITNSVQYDNNARDNTQFADTSHSPAWRRGFDDGERGMFDRRADSAEYRDGYRAGKDAVRNGNRYSDTANPPDAYRSVEPPRDERADAPRYASGDSPRRIARSACIEQAASGQPFGPDQIRTGDVRWIGQGVMAVNVDTPDGPLMCTVDRDGNVRSIESR